MGKDKALGSDPLSWMKIARENKNITSASSEKEDIVNQDAVKTGQGDSSQSAVNQQPLPLFQSSVSLDVPKKEEPKPAPGETALSETISAPKQKVVIGRLYEKLSAEKAKAKSQSETSSQEDSCYVVQQPPVQQSPAERPAQSFKRVENLISCQTSPPPSVSVPSGRMYIYMVVAYTVLLLVLGFVTYHDLSRRLKGVEARMLSLEHVLRLRK
jgi:hypothetical protein